MIVLEQDILKDLITENDKVVVQYGASWCGLCRMLKPTFKKAAKANEGILFVYVDAEKYPNSRKLATVSNLPTFTSFSSGELALNKTGSKKEFIQEVIDAVANR